MERMQKFIKRKRGKKLAGSKMRLPNKSARQTNRQMERQQSANQSDNLWRNYKSLLYVENSRDDILRGVHQKVTDSDVELEIRNKSFRDVEDKSNCMFEQIRSVFLRLPALATYDHHLLKTCVKIVDKEEGRDYEALNKITDDDGAFVSPRRTKVWRQKCLDVIKSEVAKRVIQTAPSTVDLGDDKDGTGLLIRLTAARDAILHDLEHAKSLCDIFTSEWDMYPTYVMAYYDNMMSQMQERFSSELTLSQSATVQILSWMIYCRDRVFNCQYSDCKPCQMIADLQDKFLREKIQHINNWMETALQKDIDDWQSVKEPMGDSHGLYTEFPIDILRMLEENISQAKHISPELHGHISKLCLEQLDKIMASYTANAKVYISLEPDVNIKNRVKKHVKEARPANFVQYSVALLNNFDKITSHLQKMTIDINDAQKELTENSRNNNNRRLEEEPMKAHIGKIEAQTQECSMLLWPKLLQDLNGELHSLLTRDCWLLGNGMEPVDTMCDVMASYLSRLRGPLRAWLIPAIDEMLIVAYAQGLTDKRIKLAGNKRERLQVSEKLCFESQQLERFFQGFSVVEEKQPGTEASSHWDVIRDMAGVLQIDDEETATTDITFLASKYPDMAEKHARRLLKVRGDFTRAQINKIVALSMGKTTKSSKQRLEKKTIFSKLQLK